MKKHRVLWDKMHMSRIMAFILQAQLSYLCVECYIITIIINNNNIINIINIINPKP